MKQLKKIKSLWEAQSTRSIPQLNSSGGFDQVLQNQMLLFDAVTAVSGNIGAQETGYTKYRNELMRRKRKNSPMAQMQTVEDKLIVTENGFHYPV
ncbi:hypothetical protein HOH87_07605 [bacterium]|jgi:hypothetical protein|nr:hypothetical protein [bacterium]